MSEQSTTIRYDYDFLQDFCKENGIELLKDYSLKKVNRRLHIEAKCLNKKCEKKCNKDFRNFVKNGCYCISCMFLKNNKIKYDLNYLHSYCDKNNISLLKDYRDIQVNRDTIIEAKCLINECVNILEKTFRNIVETGGCYCETHTKYNQYEKLKNSDWNNSNRIRYNTKYLINYCKENNIILLKDYTDIQVNRHTIIEAKCLKCDDICSKGFRQFMNTGCFCETHTKENRNEKVKTTCMEKYGCENPSQNAEVSEKASKNAYKSYDYIFPSGRVERIQGYENYMLNDLLQKEEVQEHDIIVNRSEVPYVWYEDLNGIKHRYFVDCFIKSQNKCIEAKSTWTAEKKEDCIYLKQEALKKAGYLCEIWIYDSKGEIVEKVI